MANLDTSMVSIPMRYIAHIFLDGLTLYLGDRHFTMDDGKFYEGRLGMGGRFIQQYQSVTGSSIPASTFTLHINNDDGGFDTYLDNYDFAGAEVHICTGTGDAFGSYDINFIGFVKVPGGVKRGKKVSLSLVDTIKYDETSIPATIYDIDSFPNVDTKYAEQHRPIIYGDWSTTAGASTLPLLAYCIDAAADGTTSIFEIANHPIGAIEKVYKNGSVVAHSEISLTPTGRFSIPTYIKGSDVVTAHILGKTGTGVNLAAVTLLEHPIDQLYDLITDVVGITTGKVDADSFVTAKSDDTDRLSRSAILEHNPSTQYMAEICNEWRYDLAIVMGCYTVNNRTQNATTTEILRIEDLVGEIPIGEYDKDKLYTNYVQGYYNAQPQPNYYERNIVASCPEAQVAAGVTIERELALNWHFKSSGTVRVYEELITYEVEREYVEATFGHIALNIKIGDTVALDMRYWNNVAMQVRHIDRNYDDLTSRLLLWTVPDVNAAQRIIPTFVSWYVNRSSAGNNVVDVEFDNDVTDNGLGYEDGFTIEVQATGNDTTWYTLAASLYTAANVDGKYIRFTFSGNSVNDFQQSHSLRISYNAGTGNIALLDTFTQETNGTNSSTVDLLDGLKSSWNMDEESGNREDDYGGHHLIPSGSPDWYAGVETKSIRFNAATENLEFAHHADHVGGDVHYVVGGRVKFTALTANSVVAAKYDSAGTELFIVRINSAGNRLEAVFNDSTDTTTSVTANTFGAIAVDTWYHWWAYHDPDANVVGITVNGSTDTSAETNGLSSDTPTLSVGAYADETANMSGYVDGLLIARGYSAVRSTDEYNSWYNSGTGNDYPYIPRNITVSDVPFEYLGATVNRSSAGNNIIDLQMPYEINSPGANYEAGWTIEMQATGNDTTWYTLDPASYTCAKQDSNYVRVTLAGTVSDIQASHAMRVTYDSGTGDIEKLSDSTALASFSNDTTLTNNSTVDLLADLVAYYKMNETSGTRVDSFAGLDLTDNNTVTSTTGVRGNAAQFDDAANEYLSRAHDAAMEGGDVHYLVSARGKFDTLSADRGLVAKINSTAAGQHLFRLTYDQGDNRIEFRITQNDSPTFTESEVWANTLGAPSTGTWYHAWGWHDPDNNELRIRVNGNEDSTGSIAGGMRTGLSAPLEIGRQSTTNDEMDGAIDGVGIWINHSTAKTTAEYNSWYNSGNGNDYPFVPDYLEAPAYAGATINRSSAGNHIIDLDCGVAIESPGGNPELGWTIEVQATGNDTTWYTLDSSAYTTAIIDTQYVRMTMTGTVKDFQASHAVRVSYSSATGDIRSTSSSTDLATFSNDTTLTNNSTVDLLADLVEYWDMEETSGNRTGAFAGHVLIDENTVGYSTGVIGNAASYDDANNERLKMSWHSDFAGGDIHYLVGARFKIDSSEATDSSIFQIWGSTDANRLMVFYWRNSSTSVRARILSESPDSWNTLTSSTTAAVNTWHHAWWWIDPDDSPVSVNERINDTETEMGTLWSGHTMVAHTDDIYVGGTYNDEFHGLIDGVGVWTGHTSVKTTAEYQSWYNSGNGNDYPFVPDYV